MNKEAGRGTAGWVVLTVGLENGKKLPLVVDTGSAGTLFDKSLASMLGELRGTGTARNYGKEHKMELYTAPKLYLGNTQLQMTGDLVGTYDCSAMNAAAKQPVKGILGMDVLEHYCVQFDFTKGEVRFLDDDRADKTSWGKAFPLVDIGDSCCVIRENLAGMASTNSDLKDGRGVYSLIDTGDDYDGWLAPEFYERWTNQAQLPKNGEAQSPNGMLGGETYPEMFLVKRDEKMADPHTEFNGIGIHFLSRHLVTLDFPKKTMYLKRTSKWPLFDKESERAAHAAARSASRFVERVKEGGRLPGCDKSEKMSADANFHYQAPHSIVMDVQKAGSKDNLHYALERESTGADWKLKKAWRTDEQGTTVEEYKVP